MLSHVKVAEGCRLRSFMQTGTDNQHSGVAICQPGSVSLVRDLQHVLFLAVSTIKVDKLQALPGIPALNTCLPLLEGLRQTLQFPC